MKITRKISGVVAFYYQNNWDSVAHFWRSWADINNLDLSLQIKVVPIKPSVCAWPIRGARQQYCVSIFFTSHLTGRTTRASGSLPLYRGGDSQGGDRDQHDRHLVARKVDFWVLSAGLALSAFIGVAYSRADEWLRCAEHLRSPQRTEHGGVRTSGAIEDHEHACGPVPTWL